MFAAPAVDKNDPDRIVFLIPSFNMTRFENELAKLNRKIERIIGLKVEPLIVGFQIDDKGRHLNEVMIADDPICYDGWRFVARIDHAYQSGNIVRALPNQTVPERFRDAGPDCQHCNHKRLRRDTLIVRHEETGEYKQVGSTCLADFLGHDVKHLAKLAELLTYAVEIARAAEATEGYGNQSLQDRRYVATDIFLNHCAATIRRNGWVSAATARNNPEQTPTRDRALNAMAMGDEVTDADMAIAAQALEWAMAFDDKPDLNDYEHNVLVVAKAPVIEYRSCGIAASIVGVYMSKHMPRPQKTSLDNMEAILSLFDKAGEKLKYPKINLNIEGTGDVVIFKLGSRSRTPGDIAVTSPGGRESSVWYGRIDRQGTFNPSRGAPAGIEKGLKIFAADPKKVAADHGKRTGNCCFCCLPLTDARSVQNGFGATCAKNYNIPYEKLAK